MTNDAEIGNVSDTSFWVAYYRAKESERADAMFRDPYAKRLVGDRGKKISDAMAATSRYAEWSVVSRTVIIDRFIEQQIAAGVDVVINLGAGLDTRPYRMNLPANLEWIEVDYPNIIAHKNEVLKNELPNCKLTRFELDLALAARRQAFFASIVPNAKNVLILTEGVIPYLTEKQVADLSKDLLAQPRFKHWVTEYFHPKAYKYLKTSVRDLKMKNAPFQFYPEHWFGFFKKLGWGEKETRFSGEIALEFKRKPPMPAWVKFLLPLIPQRVKDESVKMVGYVIFERSAK